MKSKIYAMMALALPMLIAQPSAQAQVGYNRVSIPANSDVFVSVPFTQNVTATHTVTAVNPGVGVSVTGPLTVNQYQNLFYVRFTSGAANGRWATVTANTATQLTLAVTSFLPSVSLGDTFNVYGHHTLSSVFPDGFVNVSFDASPSTSTRLTEVLVPSTAVGINKSASDTYYFRTVSSVPAWRRFGSAAGANFDNVVLPPQSQFIIRNNTANVRNFYALGAVGQNRLVEILPIESVQNDVAKSTGIPVATTLRDLMLGGTPAFIDSTSNTGNRDQLLVFNNAATGINKAASSTYFYRNGAWRLVGSPLLSRDNDVLPAGSAVLLRKFSGTPGTVDWVQD